MPGTAALAESDTDALIEDKVAADLLALIETEGEAELWVRFEGAPDFSPALAADTKTEKGAEAVAAAQEFADTSQKDVIDLLEQSGVDYESYWGSNTVRAVGGKDLLADLVGIDTVDAIVPAPEYELIEPVPESGFGTTAAEWGVDAINAPDVWDLGYDGTGVVVASIDTGVDYDHPALVNQYRGNNGDGTFTHDYNFYDVANSCAGDAPCDANGHGTHTMGTMVGDDGGQNQIGVAPGAEWIAVNGCCPSADALLDAGQWIAAPTKADGSDPDPSKAPDVVNNSWGTTQSVDDPFYEDIVALWHAAGIIPVVSLGNNGEDGCESAGSPGLYPNVIGVGAFDAAGEIGYFSARGPGRDGQVKPDIAAPGVSVRSAVPGTGYGLKSGTSMAAPHVAGAVALMLSAAPALDGDYDGVYEALVGSAVPTADGECGGTEDLNNVWGHGKLDALAAVLASPIGDTGSITGTVVDQDGAPVADADLVFTGEFTRTATTGADGAFTIPVVPTGEYGVTVNKFGYGETTGAVTVEADQAAVYDAVLTAVESGTVTGTVVDGGGHGWPLAATVSTTGGEVTTTTDPVTGAFSLTLPVGEWELLVDADYPGYQDVTVDAVAAADLTIEVPIAENCTAPGYGYEPLGNRFEGGTLPAGWTVVDRGATPWEFDDPGARGNRTPGSGGFAVADSDEQGSGNKLLDSDLISPEFDLSAADEPVLSFATDYYKGSYNTVAEVLFSPDGGATWETVWAPTANARNQTVTVDLSEWAHATEAQVKFHYNDNRTWAWWWEVDDVFVGTDRECSPIEGGLVRGTVTDLETGEPFEGATVTHTASGHQAATAADGSYWMFAPGSGASEFTAVVAEYGAATEEVAIVPDGIAAADFAIGVAEISVATTTLSTYVQQGASWSTRLTLTNTGTADGEVTFTTGGGGFAILGYGYPGDTSWLTTSVDSVTVPAGQSVSVTVKTSATAAGGVDQPGTYTATLTADYVGPGEAPVVNVSMLVVPTVEQGKLTGSVLAETCDGATAAIGDAQVQVRSADGESFHFWTDADGNYSYWFPEGDFTIIASKDGYAADFGSIALPAGDTADLSFTLEELNC
ncbi:S8 family serine peptidase [Glycomyces albidus]|uniref:alpha-amylase n=1 Tax=Glycomyces albidus TaxID=2656774 RepID=A0A6L5GBC8_9ACTN|nr:S8 family serine peptidase [Glycomyces albidus]MQM26928.1 S8 family serine peptidase [Glycomyces albidus]